MSGTQESGDATVALALPAASTAAGQANNAPGAMSSAAPNAAGNTTAMDVDDSNVSDNEPGEESEFYSDDESVYSFDSEMSYYSAKFWEQEGMLHRHHEDSYLPGHSRYPLYGRLNYDHRCTAKELKTFVNNRGLQDPYPQGITLKYYYLRLLDNADKDWRFQLMDLPAELRLVIYRHLLLFVHPSQRYLSCVGKVFPAILQTCAQINEEARHVLYDENTFTVTFQASAGQNGAGQGSTSTVHSTYLGAACRHANFIRIPTGLDDYPSFFRRIARMELRLEFTNSYTAELCEKATWPLNHFVYTLASFLMDGHRLKKLHLKLDISAAVEDAAYGRILYPLRRLRNVAEVTFEGPIPANMKAKLVEDLQSNEPSFNTMRHWKLIADDLQAQLEIHEAMHDEIECSCGECPVPECLEEISFDIYHLEDVGMHSCVGSRQEEHFMTHLASMRKFINRVNTKDLRELVDKLIQKREALVEYEAVSDDGRLEEAARIWAAKNHEDRDLKYDAEEDWSETVQDPADEIIERVAASKTVMFEMNEDDTTSDTIMLDRAFDDR